MNSLVSNKFVAKVDLKKDTSRESTPTKDNKVPRKMSKGLSQSRKTSGSRLQIRIKIEKHKTTEAKRKEPKVNTLDAEEKESPALALAKIIAD